MLTVDIDLRTTYSCIRVFKYEMIDVIENEIVNWITPSYTAFTEDD
jgi:L1 cell adhesion molecule like protein